MEIPCYQEQGIFYREQGIQRTAEVTQQLVWEAKVEGLLKAELKRRNVTYAQLAESWR